MPLAGAAGRVPLKRGDPERSAARPKRPLDRSALRTVSEAQERESEERHMIVHGRAVAARGLDRGERVWDREGARSANADGRARVWGTGPRRSCQVLRRQSTMGAR